MRETFLYRQKASIMKYRDLSAEAKLRACASSRVRYARRRDERRRENYLKILPHIKCPRPGTLRQYGLFYTEEGWVDDSGTLVAEHLFSPPT